MRDKNQYNIISSYTLNQAIEDGELIEVFKPRWDDLTGGKPIVATKAVFSEFSLAALGEIYNDYVSWRTKTLVKNPLDIPIFVTHMNRKRVWVIEDLEAFTIMFPEDY